MKQLNKLLFVAVIGLGTVAAGLYNACDAAKGAPAKFTAPRQLVGYLIMESPKMGAAKVDQSLTELQGLWNSTKTTYENQIAKNKAKLSKYSFRNLSQFRNITDPTVQKLLTDILADGFSLTNNEGKLGVDVNYSVIVPKVTRYATKPMGGYLEIVSTSSVSKVCADGALKVTPDALADRIVKAQAYIKDNPNFPKTAVVKAISQNCLSLYLLGTDNTPVFASGNKLNDKFLKSYQQSATKYKAAPLGKIVNEYLTVLKQSKNTKTKEVTDFVKKQQI